MKKLEDELKVRIRTTFIACFRHAIEHLTLERISIEDYLQIILNIQTSLELLIKLYVLEENHVEKILEEKYFKKCLPTEKFLLNLLKNGELHTKQYSLLLEKCSDAFTKDELKLIREFEYERNQIIHIGIVRENTDLILKTIKLIVSIFSNFEYKERISNDYEEPLINILKDKILTPDLYDRLLSKTKIINEVEKFAQQKSDEVHYCLECGNNTCIYEFDTYKCLLCGYQFDDYVADCIQCPECNTDNMIFDKLNCTTTNAAAGRCACCGIALEIIECSDCGNYYPVCFACKCKSK
ncbi:hypothetical protein [Treponema sp. OMZ 857]|uniref:hypothetical protein n=1 Tax=Treponema sp. OMZ 857 TaxID=1643513 RepID=UPI0020A41D63|nr:hypothetical protein [Treponema sp. OMZ 857]UTC43231.1 hypothetical protein E4N66_03525 [Treponema sp. OMZ 857]